jgi:peptidoglycan/xylan/chitin deacetylase (PgdA/CDA1 family)
MSSKTRFLPFVAQVSRYSGFNLMCRPAYGGLGLILMFHRFTDQKKKIDSNGVVSAQSFDRLLGHIRRSGPEIIALRDAPRAIAEGRRFVCLTMDDGYRCNAEIALPVLRRHNAPASIFVPTSILDRTIDAWWLQVEEAARTHANPRRAYEKMVTEIRRRPEALARLRESFSVPQEELNDRYFLSAAEAKALDRDPLIDIGGHTITHRPLKGLSDDEAAREIYQNKKDLESLLQRDVDSFAYPFGDAQACGAREYALARKAGYTVAVTTREGNIFQAHAAHMAALPRYSVREFPDGLAVFDMQRSGSYRALKTGFGSRFITE